MVFFNETINFILLSIFGDQFIKDLAFLLFAINLITSLFDGLTLAAIDLIGIFLFLIIKIKSANCFILISNLEL